MEMRSLHTATKSSPHSPQLEKDPAQQQTPNSAKKKNKKKKTHADSKPKNYNRFKKRKKKIPNTTLKIIIKPQEMKSKGREERKPDKNKFKTIKKMTRIL